MWTSAVFVKPNVLLDDCIDFMPKNILETSLDISAWALGNVLKPFALAQDVVVQPKLLVSQLLDNVSWDISNLPTQIPEMSSPPKVKAGWVYHVVESDGIWLTFKNCIPIAPGESCVPPA